MSRIGKKPIELPAGVEAKLQDSHLEVKGPKGTLTLDLNRGVGLEISENQIIVKKTKESKDASALWGLTRALVANIIVNTGCIFSHLRLSSKAHAPEKQPSHPVELPTLF